MVGQSLDELYPHGPRAAGEPMLDVEALEPGHATLTLHRGEIVGIAGLLGAGRTRLLRTIFGSRAGAEADGFAWASTKARPDRTSAGGRASAC